MVEQSDSNRDLLEIYNAALSKLRLRNLQLSFYSNKTFRKEAACFAESLPSSLQVLHLDYSEVGFKSTSEFATDFSRLSQLKSFRLKYWKTSPTTIPMRHTPFIKSLCKQQTFSTDRLWEELGKLTCLEEIDLDFGLHGSPICCNEMGGAVATLVNLKALKLSFSQCKKISNSLADLAAAFPHLAHSLTTLRLKTDNCCSPSDSRILGALGSLTCLKVLDLWFCEPSYENFIVGLGKSIASMLGLEEFSLFISRACANGDDVTELARGFAALNNLSKVKIDLRPRSKHDVPEEWQRIFRDRRTGY